MAYKPTQQPTAALKQESKLEHHSSHSQKRSEHYHAKIIGQVRPGISKPDDQAVGAAIGALKTGKATYKESFNTIKQAVSSRRPGMTASK